MSMSTIGETIGTLRRGRETMADAASLIRELSELLTKLDAENQQLFASVRDYAAAQAARDAELVRLRAALDEIACWNEGRDVCSSFDEPVSARKARAALG